MERNLATGIGVAVAATSAVGSAVAVTGLLVDYPVLTSQAARYVVAALILLLIARRRRVTLPRLNRRDLGLLLVLAATGQAGFNVCLLNAVRHAEPPAVGVVVGAVPVVLALAGPLLARRSPSARLLFAGMLATVGAAVVHGGGAATPVGLAWAVGAMLGEVGFSVFAVSLVARRGALVISVYSCLAAAAMLAGAAPLVHGSAAFQLPGLEEIAAVAYLGVIVNGFATVGWYTALQRLGMARAGLFAAVIPVATLPSALLVGTGSVGPREATGTVLVGVAILVGLRTRPRPRSQVPEPMTTSAAPGGSPSPHPQPPAGPQESGEPA